MILGKTTLVKGCPYFYTILALYTEIVIRLQMFILINLSHSLYLGVSPCLFTGGIATSRASSISIGMNSAYPSGVAKPVC